MRVWGEAAGPERGRGGGGGDPGGSGRSRWRSPEDAECGVQSEGHKSPQLALAEVGEAAAQRERRRPRTGPGTLRPAPVGGPRNVRGLLGAGGVGPASWGSPRPRQGWAFLGAPSLPGAAVSVHVLLGIRELLAAPTEILPLTAIAGRGCLHGNERVETLRPALGCCSAVPSQPTLLPASPPFFFFH